MEAPCCGNLEIAGKKAIHASGKFILCLITTICIGGISWIRKQKQEGEAVICKNDSEEGARTVRFCVSSPIASLLKSPVENRLCNRYNEYIGVRVNPAAAKTRKGGNGF